MIGDMIAKVRKEKGITKTELARITGINIGHLTHIEKGERNPSHKALKNICKALDIPYQQLMYTYDKELNEDARTKQDLLYECNSLESRLSNEIVKNEHLEQQCKKQKEIINKATEYIKERFYFNEETGEYSLLHTFNKDNIKELLDILEVNNEIARGN